MVSDASTNERGQADQERIAPLANGADSYQQAFHRRWGHLERPAVRALAWLLDSPDLLDVDAPAWAGQVATLGPVSPEVAAWLARLDADPTELDAALGERPYTRLGLYAEKLMAFYFASQGCLVHHGLQVRASRNDTVGEFDFLLEHGPDALEHIEFATKFYLQRGAGTGDLDALVGPNLADTLGHKMRKIFERQLALAAHPAAQAILPLPVKKAGALVKGWLFYPHAHWPTMQGLTPTHCRGFWSSLDSIDTLPDGHYAVLPKLSWLAPLRASAETELIPRANLTAILATMLSTSPTPLLIAHMHPHPGAPIESARGFIVPPDWPTRPTSHK